MKPFIYISGLFRSGTTLAQELLIQKDVSFIFHEPRFFEMGWQFQNFDREYIKKNWGFTMPQFKSTAEVWHYFMEDLKLQIGVKEIRNNAGLEYYNAWQGNMRLVVIERDPAEIYKSCYKMISRNSANFQWRPQYLPFTPFNLYREVSGEIKNINRLWDALHPACKIAINYQELVTCDSVKEDLYRFLESDVTDPEIGHYHSILPRGQYETGLHGGEITNKASMAEIPNKIKDDADKFGELLKGEKLWT